MNELLDVLAKTDTPIYGLDPSQWKGPVLIGESILGNDRLREIQITYLDHLDRPTRGVAFSSIGHTHESDSAHWINFMHRSDETITLDSLDEHQFKRLVVGGSDPSLPIAWRHVSLPLEISDPLHRGHIAIAAAGWSIDLLHFIPDVAPLRRALVVEIAEGQHLPI